MIGVPEQWSPSNPNDHVGDWHRRGRGVGWPRAVRSDRARVRTRRRTLTCSRLRWRSRLGERSAAAGAIGGPAAWASRLIGAATEASTMRVAAADARRRLGRRSDTRYIGISSRHGDEGDVPKRRFVAGRTGVVKRASGVQPGPDRAVDIPTVKGLRWWFARQRRATDCRWDVGRGRCNGSDRDPFG